jgi:hypothetical protein
MPKFIGKMNLVEHEVRRTAASWRVDSATLCAPRFQPLCKWSYLESTHRKITFLEKVSFEEIA